jgi:hypothetical protein
LGKSSPPRLDQQRSQPAVYQLHLVQDLLFSYNVVSTVASSWLVDWSDLPADVSSASTLKQEVSEFSCMRDISSKESSSASKSKSI